NRNAGDPTTKGEVLDKKFRYHVIPTTGEPLVHVTRTRMPEIVVFGHEQRLTGTKLLRAGKRILITPLENGDLRAGRYEPGQETVYEAFPPELDKLIRAIVKLGGGYADVIQCLQEAKQTGCLGARLAVEAVPRPNRKYYRDDDPLPEAPEGETSEKPAESTPLPQRQVATPAPDLFRDELREEQPRDKASSSEKSALGSTYIAPEYTPKKSSVLDRIKNFTKGIEE